MHSIASNNFNPRYPSVEDLKKKTRKRIPGFAYDYLTGGCNNNINIDRNTSDIRLVQLMPRYIADFKESTLSTELFGKKWSAPFGISPIGLQGMIWPGATEILAASANKYNIPFILSTVATADIEKIAEITEGNAWFQLYHPREETVTRDLLRRLEEQQYEVLVLIADVPTFGYRPGEIRNGLSMPPRMSFRNFVQIASRPSWAFNTLRHGTPKFANLLPYFPKKLNLQQLGKLMDGTFAGRLSSEKVAKLRDQWKGKLVIKGIVNPEDAELCVQLGIDGIIVSNHGGRQLDSGQSSIEPLVPLVEKFGDQMTVMMDSGIRSGPDIANSLACGAKFTFMGRPFMYGVGALGKKGGDHTIEMMLRQFKQVMEQLGCKEISSLGSCLIHRK